MEYPNLRVPAMVNRLANNSREHAERPSLPKISSYHSSEIHAHNNNQPFSYTRTTGGIANQVNSYSTLDRRLLKSPKEVVYAQVVVDKDNKDERGGRNGLHKRTVHTTFNGHTEPRYNRDTSSESPDQVIEHFVYNKENLRNGSNFRDGGYTTAKPRNVTTVLITNDDEDEEFANIKSAASRTNELFSSYHHSERERPFFYGDSRTHHHQTGISGISNASSSPPYYQFDSSRSPSPNVTSAKLVREADKVRDTYVPSAKLVNTFGGGGHHTDYSYMTSKLGEKSSSTQDYRRHREVHQHSNGYRNSEDVVDMKLLSSAPPPRNNHTHGHGHVLPEKPNRLMKSRSPPKNGFARHTNSLEKIYNNKNIQMDSHSQEKKIITTKEGKSNNHSGGGGGIISTLLRRNKEKKQEKKLQQQQQHQQTPEIFAKDEEKDGKIKRQRAKFLSVFLEKNFTSKKNNNAKTDKKNSADFDHKMGMNNKLITDSEIEEVERRRDGEYHSWSSGDDFYRFQNKGAQLNRGHSYNFGDYKKESELSAYEQNDSDYRRNLATTGTQRYTSATLGRPSGHPPSKASDDYNDSLAFRSKSLDRRAFRKQYGGDSIPQIIVTPNSPPIQTTPVDKWSSTYEIRKSNQPEWPRTKEFSKSTFELGDHRRSPERSGNGNLRYFGDTDMESTYGRRTEQDSYNTSTLNSRPSAKLRAGQGQGQGQYTPQNGYNSSSQRLNVVGAGNGTGKHLSRNANTSSQMRAHKIGGLLTRNSSESENERSGSSQRSVYLHAPAVASIPTTLPKRTLSRDEISNYSGHQKQTKQVARSMSVLSPWRPRHYQERYELNYNSNGVRTDGRPPRLPRSPVQKSISPAPERENNKTGTLQFGKNKQSNNNEKSSTISRSKSMPKNSRLGWFSRKRTNNGGAGDTGTLK